MPTNMEWHPAIQSHKIRRLLLKLTNMIATMGALYPTPMHGLVCLLLQLLSERYKIYYSCPVLNILTCNKLSLNYISLVLPWMLYRLRCACLCIIYYTPPPTPTDPIKQNSTIKLETLWTRFYADISKTTNDNRIFIQTHKQGYLDKIDIWVLRPSSQTPWRASPWVLPVWTSWLSKLYSMEREMA